MPTVGDLISIYSTQSQISSIFIDKMGIINVKSFGAIGDGVTDDSKAVQDAIDSAIENKIGMVWLPSGTYLISTALTNTDKVVFMSNSTDTVFSGNTYPIKNWSDMINDADLDAHKTSSDHDGRYYTETEVDNIVATHEADTTTHGTTGDIVGTTDTQTLTNKTINADNNTISNLEVDNFKSGVLDTDIESVSANDDTLPSAKAVKTYADRMKGFSLDLPYYYQRNVKQIATCEADENWSDNTWIGSVGTHGDNTTNYKVGLQGISATTFVADGGIKYVFASDMDLSKFNDGSDSTDDDYICFIVYIAQAEIDKMAADGYLQFYFSCDAVPTVTNHYRIAHIAKASLTAGYNFFKFAKSSALVVGSPSWSAVKGFWTRYYSTSSTAPTSAMTWTIDNIQLIRKDPSEDKPNPFQREVNGVWTRDMTINSGEWFVGEEFGEIVCRDLNPSTDYQGFTTQPFALVSSLGYQDFEITSTHKKYDTNNTHLYSIGWYKDLVNKIIWAINGNNIYLQTVENGAVVVGTLKTTLAIQQNDVVTVRLIKKGSSISLIAYKNGDVNNAVSLSAETAITGTGYLGKGTYDNTYDNIQHLAITTTSYASEAGNAHATDRNAVLYNAGAFTASTLPEGKYGIDTTNHRLYVKYPNGTVKYVALT